MMELIKEFWLLFKERKKWWMLPIVMLILVLGALLVFTESSAVAPLIYTLF